MDKSTQIDTFCRLTQVSRETIYSLIIYENILLECNKKLNLVGKSTLNQIWIRHFTDSAQIIDFIDKSSKSILDLGSGAGFPGLIIAIMAKDRKIPFKIQLLEKSKKKAEFLNKVINKLKLKAEVLNENVFAKNIKMKNDVFLSRAFKPLGRILELIHNQAVNWNKILIYQGKTGNEELLQVSKSWNIKYKQWKSVTSNDSKILEIKELKKKIV
jgi:16S rRNA (guanine527-N7)-methyltransferase